MHIYFLDNFFLFKKGTLNKDLLWKIYMLCCYQANPIRDTLGDDLVDAKIELDFYIHMHTDADDDNASDLKCGG